MKLDDRQVSSEHQDALTTKSKKIDPKKQINKQQNLHKQAKNTNTKH
jgi:hypothetical protein